MAALRALRVEARLVERVPHAIEQPRAVDRRAGRCGGREMALVDRDERAPVALEEEVLLERLEGGAIGRIAREAFAQALERRRQGAGPSPVRRKRAQVGL